MSKRCVDCGRELPEDSDFCQYCGSKNIEVVEEKPIQEVQPKLVFKRCVDCGRELPEDSDFCQYCGSKRIAVVNNAIKKEEKKETSDTKNYKKPFIAACILCLLLGSGLGYGMYHNYREFIILKETSDKQISELNNKIKALDSRVSSLTKQSETYKSKASAYDGISSALSNKQISSNFCADYYFLKKPNNKKVMIRATNYSSMYCQAYGANIQTRWGDWDGVYCPLYITFTGSGSGYVLVHNDASGYEFKIFVSGQ